MLTDLNISLKTVDVVKDVSDAHTNFLATTKRPALYPIIESAISFQSIATGLQNVQIHSIYQGILPSQVISGLIDNKVRNTYFFLISLRKIK